MRQIKSKRISLYLMTIATLLALACLMLSVGAVYARYKDQTSADPAYQAQEPLDIYLWSGMDESGEFISGESEWKTENGQKTLEFYVSNSGSAAAEEQYISVSLLASLGVQIDESVQFQLYLKWGEEKKVVYGNPQRILPASPLYETVGDGWIIRFQDENGREMTWPLAGGELSYIYARLTVSGMEVYDTSMLKLQVSGGVGSR